MKSMQLLPLFVAERVFYALAGSLDRINRRFRGMTRFGLGLWVLG